MTGETEAKALPAATILLLRDDDEGLEVFMVVRHHEIDFVPGALVFPGGKADPDDFDDRLLPHLDGAADDSDMRAMQVAAIREAFEESGVLLARPAGSRDLVDASRLSELEHYRDELHQGKLTILEFLEREQLTLACDELHHFAHWVTPTMLPKRFDTHFFLAKAPADHLALHDGHESVDSIWIHPAEALAEAKAGTKSIIFPTLRNIEKLGEHSTADAAIDAIRDVTPVRVLPWTEQREDGNYLCIPPEAGYAVCEEKMPARPAR